MSDSTRESAAAGASDQVRYHRPTRRSFLPAAPRRRPPALPSLALALIVVGCEADPDALTGPTAPKGLVVGSGVGEAWSISASQLGTPPTQTATAAPAEALQRLAGSVSAGTDGLARWQCASGGDARYPKKLELEHTVPVDDFNGGKVRLLFRYVPDDAVADPSGQITATVRLRQAGMSKSRTRSPTSRDYRTPVTAKQRRSARLTLSLKRAILCCGRSSSSAFPPWSIRRASS